MCCAVPSCCSSSCYWACFSSLPDGEGGFRTRYPREEYWSNPFGPVWPWRRLWLDSHTERAHQSVHGRCLKFDCPSLIKPFNFCILDHFKGCCCLNPQHFFFFYSFFIEPIELLNTRPRKRRDTEDAEDDDASDTAVLPRIPNPIVCLSSGDMLLFHLAINHTGTPQMLLTFTSMDIANYLCLKKTFFYIRKTAISATSRCIRRTTCLTVTPAGTLVPSGDCRSSWSRATWTPQGIVESIRAARVDTFFYTAFNSVYCVYRNITNYECASEGFTICTHTTSLTFDLSSDQEKLPRNRRKKNTFHGEKSEEPFRRATEEDPSPGWTEQ